MLVTSELYFGAMDPVTGAVVIAGLKYIGQPTAQLTAELVKDFVAKVLTPTADAAGTVIAHPIVDWQKRRVERALTRIEEAARIVHGSGGEPQPVPPRLLMPILEKASLEEDSELSERWAALLANSAMDPGGVLPAFVSILGELSPLEARFLRRIHSLWAESESLGLQLRSNAPEVMSHDHPRYSRIVELRDARVVSALRSHFALTKDQSSVIVANLERLSLVRLVAIGNSRSTREERNYITLKKFGESFMEACSVKTPSS